MNFSFPQHMNRNDRIVASFIITQAIVKNDWSISVNDGEEWTVKQSIDPQIISAAMCSTDSDTLRFRDMKQTDADGKHPTVGTMILVWGNDGECFADSSMDDGGYFDIFCESVMDKIDSRLHIR